jgi:xanthine dehydrogenase accessory factor
VDDWPRQALDRLQLGEDAALVTLLAVEGSAPRDAGTKMLVWPTGQSGTVGGGNLEHQATLQARRMLALGEAACFAVQDYPLGPLLAQCCGGRVRLLIERLGPHDAAWLAEADRLRAADQPFEIRTRLTSDGLVKAVSRVGAPRLVDGAVTINGDPARARGARPGDGDLIVERATPPQPRLLLFGAGHVGQAIARALEPLPFRMNWYDSRPDAAGSPGLTILAPDALVAIAGRESDYTLVLTHDHALDYALVAAALNGAEAGYLGLIGSKTKRARFISRLRADGFDEAALSRVVCPIGLSQLHSKAPEVIAVSVAADLLLRLEASRSCGVREHALASL